MIEKLEQYSESQDVALNDYLSKFGKISGHSLVFFTGYLFTSLIGYFFTVYIVRRLGSQTLGLYSLGLSLVTLCALLSTLGLTGAARRYIALYQGRKAPEAILGFLILSVVLIFLLSIFLGGVIFVGRSWIAEKIFNETSLAAYLAIFGILIPVSAFSMFLMEVLTGFQRVASRTIIFSYIGVLIKIIISIGLITLGFGLTGWIIGEIAAGVISIFLAAILIIRIMASKVYDFKILQIQLNREVYNFAGFMMGIGILAFTWQHISKIILGIYLNAEKIGIYSSAFIIGTFIPSILMATNSIFAPVVAELHGLGKRSQLTQLFHTVTKWVIGFTWPFTIVVIMFSPKIMGIYGDEFIQGWSVLAVLAMGQIVNVGVGSVGVLLTMSGHQRFELASGLLAASITIMLSVLLIPKIGILGAALATSLGIATANLMRLIMVYKLMHIFPYDRSIMKLFLPIVLSGVVIFLFSKGIVVMTWPIWMSIPSALVLSYLSFFLVVLVQGFDGNERLILENWKMHLLQR